jgi:hypothetical protein
MNFDGTFRKLKIDLNTYEFGDPLPEEIVPPARVVRNIKIPVAVSV